MQALGLILDSQHDSEVNQNMLQYRDTHTNVFAVQAFICISLFLKINVDWFLKLFQNLTLFASVILVLMRWWLEEEVHHPTREVNRGSPSQHLVHPGPASGDSNVYAYSATLFYLSSFLKMWLCSYSFIPSASFKSYLCPFICEYSACLACSPSHTGLRLSSHPVHKDSTCIAKIHHCFPWHQTPVERMQWPWGSWGWWLWGSSQC